MSIKGANWGAEHPLANAHSKITGHGIGDDQIMNGAIRPTLAVLIAGLLAACTSTGMGSGELMQQGHREQPVIFTWRSSDGGISGSMVAALADATYSGPFFQITRSTQVQSLEPLWSGWAEGWSDWSYWGGEYPDGMYAGMYPVTRFVTQYTGKVVASLASTEGHRMRCRFHLMDPAGGLSGGGQGQCQLSEGRVIDAMFSPR